MTPPEHRSIRFVLLILLALAWLGIWGTWIPHQTAALTQQGLDFAEWAGFLTDVRSGALRIHPDLLRAAFGLCVIALCIIGGNVESRVIRWGTRTAGIFTGILMLPPYPGGFNLAMLSFWWAGYPNQLLVAAITILISALVFLMNRLDVKTKEFAAASLAALALTAGAIAFRALIRPFEAHYAHPIPLGWGAVLFFAGLATTICLVVVNAISFKKQNGPES